MNNFLRTSVADGQTELIARNTTIHWAKNEIFH